ncbi:hypothetical protein [Limnofasciculus baicalensis]|uniref:Uncharacterized protein n=1 Tax=Limnofasciculus baicalensis BBK-W-15 TaxID=2699891 RepID=A0AAE3GVV0_9CYAN|nr:hypothetical protein [Limnofasciculus baicalensis]MCP2731590.1 hypothetical protein [Limnofasciculus baicalensis BBK-W-15]
MVFWLFFHRSGVGNGGEGGQGGQGGQWGQWGQWGHGGNFSSPPSILYSLLPTAISG